MKILVTGSSGLIGSEAVRYYGARGHRIIGVDAGLRQQFFGRAGATDITLRKLKESPIDFTPLELDIRDREAVIALYKKERPELTVHCAAQPSHDLAARIPLVDFDINAVGTMNLLEAARQWSPEAPFIHMSTNKVYGDAPNRIALEEHPTRFDFADPAYAHGIPEELSIDQSLHSLFGASKTAADLMVQEYGRYFGMPTVCFRGGCLTGPQHSGVEQHGFLSYLVRVAVRGQDYTVFGHRGKQVRDQIHAADVIAAIDAYATRPGKGGDVYNLGGGKENAASILECMGYLEALGGYGMDPNFDSQARKGDHICYYTDLRKFRADYPEWTLEYDLKGIIKGMIEAEEALVRSGGVQ